MSRLLPCLAATVLIACGPPRSGTDPVPRPAPDATGPAIDAGPDAPMALEDDLPELARRNTEMLEALGEALASSSDCAVLTGKVTEVMTSYRDVRVAAAAVADRGDGRDLDTALETYAARIKAAATQMQPALTACGGDAAFAEALTPFDT